MFFKFFIIIILILKPALVMAITQAEIDSISDAAKKDVQAIVQNIDKKAEEYKESIEKLETDAIKNKLDSFIHFKDIKATDNELSIFRTMRKTNHSFFSDVQEKIIPELLIFVSCSMPKTLLIEYAEEAEQFGAVLVIRGIYKDSLKETFKFFQELKQDGVSAIIHPSLFKKFEINQVPAIVLNDGHLPDKYTPISDKMVGSISIKYALNKFSEKGSHSKIASELISKARGDQ